MTDISLRELERLFRASNSVEDEAAWLRARAQAGELEQVALELAGHCGHSGAALACGVAGRSSDPHRNLELKAWSRRLVELGGREAAVRVLLGVGWRLRSEVSQVDLHPHAEDVLRQGLASLQAAEHWLRDPRPRSRKHAARFVSSARVSRQNPLARIFFSVASGACRALSTGNSDEVWQSLSDGIGSALSAEARWGVSAGATWDGVRSAARDWVSGSDGVRRRLEELPPAGGW